MDKIENIRALVEKLFAKVIDTDSRSEFSTNLKDIDHLIKPITNAYANVFKEFHISSIYIFHKNKEILLYEDEILFSDWTLLSVYKLGDTNYIRIGDTENDYWDDDIDIDLIFSLVENYDNVLEYAKNKHLEFLKYKIHYYEDEIEKL